MRKTKWLVRGGTCAALVVMGLGAHLASADLGDDIGGIEGVVWNDKDNDGVQDADEPGIQGVEVLYTCFADLNGDGYVDHDTEIVSSDSVLTDSNGWYRRENVPFDTWCTIELGALPAGWEPGPACPTSEMFDPTIHNWFAYVNFCLREKNGDDPGLACRFTGGGHDTDLNWDHTLEDGTIVRNGGNVPDGIDRYSFGGQAGANTAQQPLPAGEWTHTNHSGPSGSFTFHGGTSSAPVGTRIVDIRCSDPDNCEPARKAPAKQLDFDGIGTFKNIGKGKKAGTWEIANANVTAEGKGNKSFNGTFHWFEVNVDDLGEPGRANADPLDESICPSTGFGEKGSVLLADCRCPDFYRITIYDGVDSATLASSGPNTTDVIYEAYGYIDGGNLQIHPPTGFDTKRASLGIPRAGPTPVSDGGRVQTRRRTKVGFGRLAADKQEKTRKFTIKNRSRTEPLVVTVGAAVAPFGGGGQMFVIQPREKVNLEFSFAPIEAGRYSDSVVVQTSDENRPSFELRLVGRKK